MSIFNLHQRAGQIEGQSLLWVNCPVKYTSSHDPILCLLTVGSKKDSLIEAWGLSRSIHESMKIVDIYTQWYSGETLVTRNFNCGLRFVNAFPLP